MEINAVNSQEFAMRHRVSGKSTINHSVRVNEKLSCEEYVIIDFVYTWNSTKNTPIKIKDFYRETGFAPIDVTEFLQKLKSKELLVWDDKLKRIDVYEHWKVIFSSSSKFDQIWSLHSQGNKKIAKERLPKVLKKISIEELTERLTSYLAQCGQMNRYTMDLATWLHPDKEHWNDVLPAISSKDNSKHRKVTQIKFK